MDEQKNTWNRIAWKGGENLIHEHIMSLIT